MGFFCCCCFLVFYYCSVCFYSYCAPVPLEQVLTLFHIYPIDLWCRLYHRWWVLYVLGFKVTGSGYRPPYIKDPPSPPVNWCNYMCFEFIQEHLFRRETCARVGSATFESIYINKYWSCFINYNNAYMNDWRLISIWTRIKI